jgi:ABC-type polysaccharide/polyol phosphate export permease
MYDLIIFTVYGIIFYTLKTQQTTSSLIVTTTLTSRALINKRRETKLLIMSVFTCLVQFMVTAYIVIMIVFWKTFDPKLDYYNFFV